MKSTSVHITSWLNCCNYFYFSTSRYFITCRVCVQNTEARLLSGKKQCDHITPVLASLHWLLVHCRIQFQILLFAFMSPSGFVPSYLTWSVNQLLLEVSRCTLKVESCSSWAGFLGFITRSYLFVLLFIWWCFDIFADFSVFISDVLIGNYLCIWHNLYNTLVSWY